MRGHLLLTVGAIIVCSGAYAAERFGFKSIVLGMPLSDVTATGRYECKPEDAALDYIASDTVCSLRSNISETIANVPVETLIVKGRDNRVISILVAFDWLSFPEVFSALEAKYGPPTAIDKKAVAELPLLGPIEQVQAHWEIGEYVIATRRLNPGTNGSSWVTYVFKSELESEEAAEKKRKRSSADDM